MKIWSLTYEKAQQLRAQLEEKTQAVEDLEGTDPSDIWLKDLDDIEEALEQRDVAMEAACEDERRAQSKNTKYQAKKQKKVAVNKKKATKKKSKKADEWDSDLENDSDDDFNTDVVNVAMAEVRKPTVEKKVTQSKKVRAPKKKTEKVSAPLPASIKEDAIIELSDQEDDIFAETLSLAERMKKKLMVSPKKSFEPSTGGIGNSKKRPSPREMSVDEDEDCTFDFDDEEEMKAPKKVVKKTVAKKPASKRAKSAPPKKMPVKAISKKVVESDSEDDIEFDEDDEEDDIEFDEDDEEDFAPSEPVKPRARAGRATKQISYVVDISSDDDSEFEG
jgi:hypothetical protein